MSWEHFEHAFYNEDIATVLRFFKQPDFEFFPRGTQLLVDCIDMDKWASIQCLLETKKVDPFDEKINIAEAAVEALDWDITLLFLKQPQHSLRFMNRLHRCWTVRKEIYISNEALYSAHGLFRVECIKAKERRLLTHLSISRDCILLCLALKPLNLPSLLLCHLFEIVAQPMINCHEYFIDLWQICERVKNLKMFTFPLNHCPICGSSSHNQYSVQCQQCHTVFCDKCSSACTEKHADYGYSWDRKVCVGCSVTMWKQKINVTSHQFSQLL